MPMLIAGAVRVPCRAVIFDKDGTLIEQDGMLLAMGHARHRAMAEIAGEAAARRWAERVGFDLASDRVDPHGPLASAPKREEVLLAAGAVYQEGLSWIQARALAEEAYALADAASRSPFGATVLQGIPMALDRLRQAGLRLAVATTDRRQRTIEMLRDIGLGDAFDTLIAVDDVANGKPAPDMVLACCRALGVEPDETAVVGDTESDMRMGRAAGVALCIGVKTGSNRGSGLEGLADVILDSAAHLQSE